MKLVIAALGTDVPVGVGASDKISGVKAQIELFSEKPAAVQVLSIESKKKKPESLEDDKTLSDYNLGDGGSTDCTLQRR